MKFLMTLLLLIPSISFSMDEEALQKKFIQYAKDYNNLIEECAPTISKDSIMGLIDLENCVWTKDQTLLYRYDFEEILLTSAHRKYVELFNLAKAGYVGGSHNGWADQKIEIQKNYFFLQWEILKKYFGF